MQIASDLYAQEHKRLQLLSESVNTPNKKYSRKTSNTSSILKPRPTKKSPKDLNVYLNHKISDYEFF